MKILFLNAYFYPENIAFTHLESDFMEGLIAAGHELTVVCPVPCRGIPGDTVKAYRNKKAETYRGINIRRYWAPVEGNNPVLRAFRYFWCNLRGNMTAKRYRDADVIFAVSTPPTQGYYAGKLAKKLGVPFVYSLQDVFPDSLVTTGMTSSGSLLYRFGARIERKTYKLCSRIIVISETVKKNLLSKNVPSEKLTTVCNWIDPDKVYPVPREENRLFDEYNVGRDKFTVVYAGNFGASQGAGIILEAASLLKDNKDIVFVIFGTGAEFRQAVDTASEKKLSNVVINPILPPDRVPEVYSMGDVALITCKKGVGKVAMPSKLWSIMACDTPIIASFDTDSELSDILLGSGCGACVEPENAGSLAEAIDKAYLSSKDGEPVFKSGREYVSAHNSKQVGVAGYVSCIENVRNK